MQERMNKEELIKLIESLKLDKNEYWILSSGALVMRGIYPDAGDLDIAVTEKGLQELKKNYNLKEKQNGWYIINDKIECVLDTKESWKIEKYGEYNLQSIEKYYDFLKKSNRAKDKERIPLIEKYIEKRDLYDEKRNLTGETIFKGQKIPDQRYILVVLVFIQNSEGKFLIQKRSKIKNGKFATTGGHPKAGENSIQGIITEVEEEIGLKLNEKDLQLYFSGQEGKAFWDDYYIKMDIPDISKLKLQEEEVESLHWFSINEIKQLMLEDKFFKNHYEEFERLLNWLN